jgi:glycerol-3-phosphate dehydrogenase
MFRDLARLANTHFDAVIAGGGVYGLAIAWDLASRGVRVALVERGDFGGATSFNSLKTVHGGVRPLQHGALREVREFVRERRAMATIAPHLVRPLPFVVPTYRHPVRNRLTMGAFFTAYDRLSADRNRGVDPSRGLPRSRTVGRSECLRLNPAIDPAGVTGGAIWYDYQLHSPERFALALLHSATQAGAAVANYVEADTLIVRDNRVHGLRVTDRVTRTPFDIRASVVVNAAGPWTWRLFDARNRPGPGIPRPRFSVAMNLVVDRPPLPNAVGGLVDGRFLFMVPWRDRAIVGTSHDEPDAPGLVDPPERLAPNPRLVDALLSDAQQAFPKAGLTRESIALVHRGLLPAGARHGTLLKRSIVHDHAADGLTSLITVIGVRYTTARATAEVAGDAVCGLLGRDFPASQTAHQPLWGGDMPNVVRFEREQCSGARQPELVSRLIGTYGTRYSEVAAMIERDAALGQPLSPATAVTGAEILFAIREEMALHLQDALLRRTAAGTAGHPGADAIARAADLMAGELAWTPERRQAEIAAVDRFYEQPG